MQRPTAIRASALAIPFMGTIAIGFAPHASPISGGSNGGPKAQLPKEPPKDAIAPAPLFVPTPPKPTGFRVFPAVGVIDKTLALHERVAAGLSKATFVPDERIDANRWLDGHPTLVVTGWDACIEDVTQVQGGYLVQLQVSPAVASTEGGGYIVVSPATVETWFLGKKSSEYQGSRPSELAGASLGL